MSVHLGWNESIHQDHCKQGHLQLGVRALLLKKSKWKLKLDLNQTQINLKLIKMIIYY